MTAPATVSPGVAPMGAVSAPGNPLTPGGSAALGASAAPGGPGIPALLPAGSTGGLPPEALADLRPLHAPPPPPFWPPAPGWWLLACLAGLAGFIYWRRRRRLAPRRAALVELERILAEIDDLPDRAAAINRLLKRYALVCSPRSAAAGLTGQAWLAFLGERDGGSSWRGDAGMAMIRYAYDRPESRPAGAAVSVDDEEALSRLPDMARRWIEANAPRGGRNG